MKHHEARGTPAMAVGSRSILVGPFPLPSAFCTGFLENLVLWPLEFYSCDLPAERQEVALHESCSVYTKCIFAKLQSCLWQLLDIFPLGRCIVKVNQWNVRVKAKTVQSDLSGSNGWCVVFSITLWTVHFKFTDFKLIETFSRILLL